MGQARAMRIRKVQGADALYRVAVDGVTVHRLMRMSKETGEEYEHILARAVALWDLVSHSKVPLKGYSGIEKEARSRRHADVAAVGSVVGEVLRRVVRQKG